MALSQVTIYQANMIKNKWNYLRENILLRFKNTFLEWLAVDKRFWRKYLKNFNCQSNIDFEK